MGVGPCGPNTEIFFDRGSRYDTRGRELLEENISNDRYIEIWNIVFSQFNNDGSGNYTDLKARCIDTGAGLERIASILQDAPTNFDTDLFLPIIREIERLTGKTYISENFFTKDEEQAKKNRDFKIVADHMRAVCNLIADGQDPSNISRGYIIRRLIRRASFSMCRLLGERVAKLSKLVGVVNEITYYKFDRDLESIKGKIQQEEERFLEVLRQGTQLLRDELARGELNTSPETLAFKLYETHGLLLEITVGILAELGIEVNSESLDELQREHSKISKSDNKDALERVISSLTDIGFKGGEFCGYDNLESDSKILSLGDDEGERERCEGESYLILDTTPFYARRGGQNSDEGEVVIGGRSYPLGGIFIDKYGNYVHKVTAPISKTDTLHCKVDKRVRLAHARNHSATHLLFATLRETYPDRVILQEGSDITASRFTFDFSLNRRPTEGEIGAIETRINQLIKQDIKRTYLNSSLQEARGLGAVITAEEEGYLDPNNVRLVDFKGVTLDVCGGTHVASTAEIEAFKIVSVKGKGAEKFRITAITSSELVVDYYKSRIREEGERLLLSASKLSTPPTSIDKLRVDLANLPNSVRELEGLLARLLVVMAEVTELRKSEHKERQRQGVDLSLFKCLTLKEQRFCISVGSELETARRLAASARGRMDSRLNITLSAPSNDGQIGIFITSQGGEAKDLFDYLKGKLTGVRGGGVAGYIQGVFVGELGESEVLDLLRGWLGS